MNAEIEALQNLEAGLLCHKNYDTVMRCAQELHYFANANSALQEIKRSRAIKTSAKAEQCIKKIPQARKK